MFRKIKEIDTAFRHVKRLAALVVVCCTVVTAFVVYHASRQVSRMQDKIYVVAGGSAFQASAVNRSENITVEAQDHVATFHRLFFTLSPDDDQITSTLGQALYLADHSAKRMYDDLRENGFYNSIVSGNVDQSITVDSVVVNSDSYPYPFTCYATQSITRPASITYRSLVTTGMLRTVPRSTNNSHGFLIERWKIIANQDLKTMNR